MMALIQQYSYWCSGTPFMSNHIVVCYGVSVTLGDHFMPYKCGIIYMIHM